MRKDVITLTDTHPPLRRGSPAAWALTSGITGFVADVLLVLDQLTENVGDVRQSFMWLPAAIAWVMVVQFLTLIPVALALRRWLPPTRSVRLATAVAVGAMLAVAIFQLLFLTGVLEFDVQVQVVVATFLLVSAWVIVVSSTGHRHGTLPRSVTRFGLLLGASYPVGALIATVGLLFSSGSAAQLAFVIPGAIIAGFGWLALPVWPLVLARRVFNKPPSPIANEEGTLPTTQARP
jgi:hypothetical protein